MGYHHVDSIDRMTVVDTSESIDGGPGRSRSDRPSAQANGTLDALAIGPPQADDAREDDQ